jgi:hypothetical protein
MFYKMSIEFKVATVGQTKRQVEGPRRDLGLANMSTPVYADAGTAHNSLTMQISPFNA